MRTLDIRVPMGVMFTLLGLILAAFGAFTAGSPMYRQSLDVNVNLWWGLIILLFGAGLLALAWRAARRLPRTHHDADHARPT